MNPSSELLHRLADKYETEDFINGDPSWFMHKVEGRKNQETMAFLASCLSFGSRKQFLPKIDFMLKSSGGNVAEWVETGAFERAIPPSDNCYYRLYTYRVINHLLRSLREMMTTYGSIADFTAQAAKDSQYGNDVVSVLTALAAFFRERGLKGIVPAPLTSVCKRPSMFLRWMVRTGSPVDLGIWSEIIDRRNLLIPLDTHVAQVARSFGLISTKTTSWTTAVALTKRMAEVFPDDPSRGDFALYGLGIDNHAQPNI